MNQYLEEWNQIMGENASYNYWDRIETKDYFKKNILQCAIARETLIKKYAYAIPSSKALEEIAKFSPLIEIGAGRGYWAAMIEEYGGNVLCFDIAPPNTSDNNHYFSGSKIFHEVFDGGPEMLSEMKNIDAYEFTLFLCWPPYSDSMAYDCLRRYVGENFIFVGEDNAGDDQFWELLNKEWYLTNTIEIPQWDGIHDRVTFYKRFK